MKFHGTDAIFIQYDRALRAKYYDPCIPEEQDLSYYGSGVMCGQDNTLR